MNGQAGKGDLQRPRQISDLKWAENWERAFGKKVGLPSSNPDRVAKTHGESANDKEQPYERKPEVLPDCPCDYCTAERAHVEGQGGGMLPPRPRC